MREPNPNLTGKTTSANDLKKSKVELSAPLDVLVKEDQTLSGGQCNGSFTFIMSQTYYELLLREDRSNLALLDD